MLSRRFADARGMVWFFDKRQPGIGIRDALPINLMLQRYLYSETNQDGTKDHSLEYQYSDLESDASIIFDKIERLALMGLVPVLPRQERDIIDEFVCAQWRRVPDFNERVFNSERFPQIVAEVAVKYEQQIGRALTEAERQELELIKTDKDVKHRTRVRALKRPAAQVLAALAAKSLQFLISSAGSTFVLGSSPVLKTSPGKESSNLNHDQCEVRFAFHPKVALLFTSPWKPDMLVNVPGSEVDFYNTAVARKSSIIASNSKASVATHAGLDG